MENLAKFVKRSRRAARLKQPELAQKGGVGLRFIREMEQGKTTLRMDAVNKVLRLFGKYLGPIDLPRE
jgi:y4mF family transcriptional regulator